MGWVDADLALQTFLIQCMLEGFMMMLGGSKAPGAQPSPTVGFEEKASL